MAMVVSRGAEEEYNNNALAQPSPFISLELMPIHRPPDMEKKASFDDRQDADAGSIVPFPQTKRGLSSRHVQLMAIGGSIGTGLFVGIGAYLRDAGPLSLLLGYLVWGIFFILPINLSVGEMCAYLPIRGSIFELAARYVDPAFGFAM